MNRIRKFALRSLAVLGVLLVAGIALRHAAGALLVLAVMGPFDPTASPPPPDYALPESWAASPGKADPSDRLPEGLPDDKSPSREHVDVFYIHPTGFDRRDNWNGTVGEEASHGIPTSVMLAGQASAFSGCGQVYAPAYRQASIFAYAQPLVAPLRDEGYRALDLAYSDIARAFDHFIEHFSKGRPFIIASHSQGSVHALRLLAEKVDGTPLYPRLVAAYVVGCGMPMDYFERVYKDIEPCSAPGQTGCLVAWDTLREGAWLPALGVHHYPGGWERATGKPTFSVNPLTWSMESERAPKDLHAGALLARFVSASEHPDRCLFVGLSPGHTWAECRDGRVWVENQDGTVFADRYGVYHLFDYNLFWVNVRENARLRAETYLVEKGLIPPPENSAVVAARATF